MFKKIASHLRSNEGNIYLEASICLAALLIISVIIFTVTSSLMTKLWLDEKMSDIAQIIDANGTVKTESISKLEQEIVGKLGGTVSYVTNYLEDDAESGCVQLNEVVEIHYDCEEYTVIDIGGFEISTPIHLHKTAVSSVYYKPIDEKVDTY